MADFAERLWEARKQGGIVRPEDVIEPSSTEEAYAIQGQIVRLSGCEVRGFKVGSTSKEAQQFLGTSEPGSGALLAPYLHMTPAQVVIAPLQMPAVEGEFAFRLGEDLPPREAVVIGACIALSGNMVKLTNVFWY